MAAQAGESVPKRTAKRHPAVHRQRRPVVIESFKTVHPFERLVSTHDVYLGPLVGLPRLLKTEVIEPVGH